MCVHVYCPEWFYRRHLRAGAQLFLLMSAHLSTHTSAHTLMHSVCVCLSEPLSTVRVVPNEAQTNEGQQGDKENDETNTCVCVCVSERGREGVKK